jgi:protein pelota
MEYLLAQVGKRAELQLLLDNKDRFVKARCSSGHKHSLKEVLQDPAIMEQLKDVKAKREKKKTQTQKAD